MKQTFILGTIPSNKDKYFDEIKESLGGSDIPDEIVKSKVIKTSGIVKDIKQTLVEKGVATELTPNEELSEKMQDTMFLTEILEMNPTLVLGLTHTLEKGSDNLKATTSNEWLTDEILEKLVPILNIYLRKNKSAALLFLGCTLITKIPKELDLTWVINMDYMFKYAKSLLELDFKGITLNALRGTCFQCESLHTIKNLDLLDCYTYINSAFHYCYKLTNFQVTNVIGNLQIGSGTSWGHLLTLESLINTCKECIKQSATRKLTVGTANLAKLADVYVKFTDSSVTSIATGQKGDVVVCESTDEGAMTITEYMTLKSWTLA